MRIKERNRQQGALARAEIEEEGFLRSQEESADHDRMKLFRELGVRSLESKILGLIGVEPYPALPGGIVFEAAKFLERPFQPRVVQDPVMKPHRLEVLTRQRSQKRLIRHFRCLTKSRNLRDFHHVNGRSASWRQTPIRPGRWQRPRRPIIRDGAGHDILTPRSHLVPVVLPPRRRLPPRISVFGDTIPYP